MTVVGVVPAAGYALRLQPLPHSKEVLEVGGRPIMDYLVDRMWAGGADEVRVVTRPEKTDVIANAERLGASVVLARPATINDSLAAGIAGLAPADIVLLGFPDSLWDPPDGFRRLADAVVAGPRGGPWALRLPRVSRARTTSSSTSREPSRTSTSSR